MRKSKSENGHNINIVYKDIEKAIIKSKGIPIGINNENFEDYLNICQGFILQGGDDIDNDNLIIIQKLYDLNIPVLGICLGMQEMAHLFNGKEVLIENHHHKTYHDILIIKDTLLHKIIGVSKITINSRHLWAIYNTSLKTSSKANDNVIESVEDSDKKFFLGLQWHPENMYEYDLNSRKIFDYFIKVCNDK